MHYTYNIHSSFDGHQGCFHFLVVMSNVTLNICIQVVCVCMYVCVHMVFITPGYIPRSRNYWVIQKLCLAFARTTRCFSHSSCVILYYQQQYKRIQFLPTLTNICFCPYISLNIAIHSSECKVVPHCGFVFHFPDDK